MMPTMCSLCCVALKPTADSTVPNRCPRCGTRYDQPKGEIKAAPPERPIAAVAPPPAQAVAVGVPPTSASSLTEFSGLEASTDWPKVEPIPPSRQVRGRRRIWPIILAMILVGSAVGVGAYYALRDVWQEQAEATEEADRKNNLDESAHSSKQKTSVATAPVSLLELAAKPIDVPNAMKAEHVANIYQTLASTAFPPGKIDELVFGKLAEKGITPAAVCSDAVFLRRVYLDAIGTLPTANEARAFLKDSDPNKRKVLIDRLLDRKEFSDYWTMKWSDILRVKSEFPINLWPNGVRSYHHWIRTALRENWPYDKFAHTLVTSQGSNFRSPPVNFYRAMQGRDPRTAAQAVALTFMGVRAEGFTSEQWTQMEVFFSQIGYKATREWKEEIVFFDPAKPRSSSEPSFPDGTTAKLVADEDPRTAFAEWLITPRNPWFTRSIANRVWSWLLGRGIIHEPDDIRSANLPSHPELLAYLEQELVAAKYDVKQLFRAILNSKTYQLACIPSTEHTEAVALFAYYPVRRLEAEVLIDAICQITGTEEHYSSPIPEPFTFLPPGHRAISLPDASITSPFLEMFGRPPRDTGLESERNNNFTAAQRLHLLNSSHIQQKISKGPELAPLFSSDRSQEQLAEELYLRILSRFPTPAELSELRMQGGRASGPEIVWALINSAEFLCRH